METVLLSTHNLCFGYEIRKLFSDYAFLFELPDNDFIGDNMIKRHEWQPKQSLISNMCLETGPFVKTELLHGAAQ